jgi:hypothetical protein
LRSSNHPTRPFPRVFEDRRDRRDHRKRRLTVIIPDIERDAIRNFERLQELRDNETGPVRIRLRAAQTIAQQLDRMLPRRARG